MKTTRSAQLRPDQTAGHSQDTILYVLDELIAEAETQADNIVIPEFVIHWQRVKGWLKKEKQVAQNINPYSGEEMDAETIAELRRWEAM